MVSGRAVKIGELSPEYLLGPGAGVRQSKELENQIGSVACNSGADWPWNFHRGCVMEGHQSQMLQLEHVDSGRAIALNEVISESEGLVNASSSYCLGSPGRFLPGLSGDGLSDNVEIRHFRRVASRCEQGGPDIRPR